MKGDAQWAFNQFRERFLPAFISDLKALEAAGFKNPKVSCPRVGAVSMKWLMFLKQFPTSDLRRPERRTSSKSSHSFIWKWNNKDGDSPETREERARALQSSKPAVRRFLTVRSSFGYYSLHLRFRR